MANNTTLTNGDSMRTIDRTTYETPTTLIDVGGSSSEALLGDSTNTLPVGGLAAENGAVSGKPVLVAGRYDSSARTLDNGDVGAIAVTAAGSVQVVAAAGSALLGDVGLSGARTSGGTTIFRSIDLDETEEEVKATAGQVYWIQATNLSASVRFLKFYNATAASVTVGTTTPVLTIPLPTLATTNGREIMLPIPNGVAFDTAICVAATTGIADADTGAPGANEVVVNIGYA